MRNRIRRFGADRRGNIAITFGQATGSITLDVTGTYTMGLGAVLKLVGMGQKSVG